MSDSLRVRLEFKHFQSERLKNSLLSFRRSDIKDVESLENLIKMRFKIKESFCLNIDDFVCQQTEPIDIIRDNDLIVVEPIITYSKTKITENVVKQENKSMTYEKQFSVPKQKVKKCSESETSSSSKKRAKHMTSGSDSSRCSGLTSTDFTPKDSEKRRSENSSKKSNDRKSINKEVEKSEEMLNESDVKMEIDSNDESNASMSSEMNLFSARNTPLRKAFLSANTSIKKKPINTPKVNPNKNPKPKRLTQEARDPVDEFSPIIILEKIMDPLMPTIDSIHTNGNKSMKKQSARKSFPSPTDTNNKSKDTTVANEIINEDNNYMQRIDCSVCEPLTQMPQMGDIIGFKMLTLSADNNGYETSQFKKGSVLNVNVDNNMVDILLEDGIQKNTNQWINITEPNYGIQALKINWSTVLEPKLIHRSSALK